MKFRLLCSAVLVAGLMSSSASAAITAYDDDFEGYGAAAFFTPWAGFSDNGGFPGGYGFTPSTNGPQITALADDGNGNHYMNFYANYENATVHQGNAPNPQEAISVFINQSFTAADTASGATWYFDFDFAFNPDAPPAGATETGAFIRVFNNDYSVLLDEQPFDTRALATAAFQGGSLSQTLNPAWGPGQIQFGFNNLVGGYENSGMFYDNVRWANTAAVPEPGSLAMLGLGAVGLIARRRRR